MWIAVQIAMAAVSVGALLLVMLVVKRLATRFDWPAEVQRKLVHIATGLYALTLPWLFPERWPVYMLVVISLLVLMMLRLPRVAQFGIGSTLHSVERQSWGDILLTLAVGMTFFLSGDDLVLYMLPIAVLTLADAAAALAGTAYGKRFFIVEEGRKSFEGAGSPPFLMEPTSGTFDLESFQAAGFAPVAHYLSARQSLNDDADGPRPPPRSGDGSIRIASWDGTDPERFFTEVHALSVEAFAANPFYRPIPLADFLAIYLPLVPMMRRELIFFARSADEELQGFFFAVPDYQQGPATTDVIFKTYASRVPGAGRLLVEHAVYAAAKAGFMCAVHALMHGENLSADRSGRIGGEVFRRYALMGRVLNG